MSKNNDGIGPIQAKTGDSALAIERPKGFSTTMGALHDSTKSQYPHTDKHYNYEGLGDLDGSLHHPAVGHTESVPQGTY